MSTFSHLMRIPVLLAVFAVMLVLAPLVTHAQATSASLSFDPAVNPALKGYEYNTVNGPGGQVSNTPDGQCVLYNAPNGGGLITGCVKDGTFVLNGSVVGGTGEASTVRSDSNGAVATGPAGGEDSCPQNIGKCFVDAITYSMNTIVGGLALVLLTLASFILWIAGGVFNWVVIKTVFEFGSTFGTSEGMLIAWGIIRDIGNIVLLFSFIFMGLATILNTHALDEYSARKALPRLIIFAVLLNFSLFAAQIVIDVSNSLASVFTAQAGLTDCSGNDELSRNRCADNGIAGQVIQMAGISSVFSIDDAKDFFTEPSKATPVYIGLAIFITVTAVVLLAAAIMLVARAVMLCLLMVLSPIGFAGMAIPPLQEFASSWWKRLLSNAFFAPVYLLLVLISLKLLEELVSQGEGGSLAHAFITGGMNAPQVFVVFTVVIGFMVASLIVAKSMGAAGADFATKTAGGAVLGSYGFIGRRTLGRASVVAGERIRKSALGKTETGRFLAGIADRGATASYSARGVASTLGKGAHLDFGKPNKDAAHGYHGIEEKAVKARTEYAKSLIGRDKTREEKAAEAARAEETGKREAEAKPLELSVAEANKKVKEREEEYEKRRAAAAERVATTGFADAALEAEAAKAEAELKLSQSELAKASSNLTEANTALAAARRAEAETKAANDNAASAKGAKNQYGKNLEERAHDAWLGGHTVALTQRADHHASAKIVSEANKSDVLKAIEAAAKEEASKAVGSGGGGQPAAAGGGGGGHH